jgi:hypothetical protein
MKPVRRGLAAAGLAAGFTQMVYCFWQLLGLSAGPFAPGRAAPGAGWMIDPHGGLWETLVTLTGGAFGFLLIVMAIALLSADP